MIEVKNVVKTFDGFAALNDATLSVPTGAVYGLVGPNGAGKSTIIRHLTGIFRQDSGTVRLGGEDVWENAALKAKIAAIPDDWYYFNSAGIGDMMRFYKGFYPNFSTERYEKLREVFELDEKRPIRRFSKGMQKRASMPLQAMVRHWRPLQSIRSRGWTSPSHRFSASVNLAASGPKFFRKSLPVPMGMQVTAALSKPAAPLTTSFRVPSPPQA